MLHSGDHTQSNRFMQGLRASLDRSRLGELLVRQGRISTSELRRALKKQKETKASLGEILIKDKAISRFDLHFTLSRQFALRCTAGFFLFCFSIVGMGKKAQAELSDVAGTLQVSMTKEFTNVSYYPQLFETQEKRSSNLKAFTKWTGMFDRFESQLRNASTKSYMEGWARELSQFSGMSLKQMARQVNRVVNQTRYIEDKNLWGKTDYWATPAEFLKRGGDCEDFAITKYTALRALGVPESRLRIAIVQDEIKNIPHAVLVVYTDGGAYVLDNQIKTLIDADNMTRYRPIFSINRQAWWLHTAEPKTILASAN